MYFRYHYNKHHPSGSPSDRKISFTVMGQSYERSDSIHSSTTSISAMDTESRGIYIKIYNVIYIIIYQLSDYLYCLLIIMYYFIAEITNIF